MKNILKQFDKTQSCIQSLHNSITRLDEMLQRLVTFDFYLSIQEGDGICIYNADTNRGMKLIQALRFIREDGVLTENNFLDYL